MKKYIIILIILSIGFLLFNTYKKPGIETPISQAGGGGTAGAFYDTPKDNDI